MSNIERYETSLQNGMPVECYKFTCDGTSYCYTSRREDVTFVYEDGDTTKTEIYNSEFIVRDDITPGSKGNECETVITVAKDNPVAMLYQGTPPEQNCDVEIRRSHVDNINSYDIVYRGRVTQVAFENTRCEITVTLENWMSKEIPNGMYQYFCNNMLFDKNCRLKQSEWSHEVFLDKNEELVIFSTEFEKFDDGYFTNGKIYFNGQVRVITEHKGNKITLRYPFWQVPRNYVTVTAGCDRLFSTCCKRFKNHLNFTGFPYCPPTDSEKNPTGKGVYWVDNSVIKRDTNGEIGNISL